MGDEAAIGVDHIGAAVLADLDLGDHVPDQLEIDLAMLTPVSRRVPASESVI
jgi:hypothetical protein